MSINIVNIMLENLLPKNLADNVMNFNGGVDAWLPDKASKSLKDKIKKCIRKDNFKLGAVEKGGRGGKWVDKYIEIKVDEKNIKYVIENNVKVEYNYPTKYGFMERCEKIDKVKDNFVWIGKYKLCLNKFEYLKIRCDYERITIREMDD